MSFYIKNLLTEEDIAAAVKIDSLLIVRFGWAEDPEAQRIDKMLLSLQETGYTSFRVAACETRDMPSSVVSKYSLSVEHRCALMFFFKQQPVSISFNRKRTILITERIAEYSELISLIVLVQQGLTQGHKTLKIPLFSTPSTSKRRNKPRRTANK